MKTLKKEIKLWLISILLLWAFDLADDSNLKIEISKTMAKL